MPICTNDSSNAGYCFVDFSNPAAAAKGLQLNGQVIPNSQRPFKLNWASGGGLADRTYVLYATECVQELIFDLGMSVDPSIPFLSAIWAQRSMNMSWYRSSRTAFPRANPPKS